MSPCSPSHRKQPSSSIEVCFDDGDLFWGHALLARVNPEGEPEHAEFFG